MTQIKARIGLQQRVLPAYRAPLFDALAAAAGGELSVFAGAARPQESIETGRLQTASLTPARNLHLLGGRFYLCYQAGLIDWLEEWQPEVFIAEANPRYLRTPAAIRWMHARHRPVIGWGLGAPAVTGRFPACGPPNAAAFCSISMPCSPTAARERSEYAAAGFPAERIFVAPNAAAPRPSHPCHSEAQILAQMARVLFVGRLQERKRVDNLLKACAALPEGQRPQVWIVGDGPDRTRLEALASQVYPQAHFFGARHGAELAPLFAAADLFVLPGTGGLAVQQAMAYGLPVMAAEADGTQTDLVRPENGWALPPGDLPALTAALAHALSDPARLRRWAPHHFALSPRDQPGTHGRGFRTSHCCRSPARKRRITCISCWSQMGAVRMPGAGYRAYWPCITASRWYPPMPASRCPVSKICISCR
jgi:glycosyltransferase involved in cell wall biosynthesis